MIENTFVFTCTHTYTHPLNSLCTHNHHSFTAIPVEFARLRSFSFRDRFLSIYYNKIVVLSDLSARLSISRSIQLLSALHPLFIRWYFTNLLTTSIWSPRIVFVSLKFLRTISNFTVRSLATKAQNIRNQFFFCVSFFLVFRWCTKIDRRGVFKEGIHEFLESCFLESRC